MGAGEMETPAVVLQEQWLEMRQMVPLAEEAPDTIPHQRCAAFELGFLNGSELVDKGLVDSEILPAVLPLAFVLMMSYPWLKKLCHHKIRIAEEGGDAGAAGRHPASGYCKDPG